MNLTLVNTEKLKKAKFVAIQLISAVSKFLPIFAKFTSIITSPEKTHKIKIKIFQIKNCIDWHYMSHHKICYRCLQT